MATTTAYSHLQALVVDDMPTQQTTLRGQLGMLGISNIDAASSADDALRLISGKNYGLILCDYNLNHRTDGQQLFEYLREQRLIGPDCLFFMVTAENNYSSVAAASEHLPDAYLLKPFTASDLEERLKAQLEKRQALLDISKRLRKGDLGATVAACDALLAKRDRWYMHALQIKGQALLDLSDIDEARKVYETALELRSGLLWAQIGLARCHKAAGQFEEARQLAQNIVQSRDGEKNLAAFDILAQSLEASGDAPGAAAVLKQAAQVVPSARRLRLLAESAYRNGDLETARASFGRAIKASQNSITAQPQDLLALAQVQVDLGEAKEAVTTLSDAATKGSRSPEFDTVALAIRAQAHVALGDSATAAAEASQALTALKQSKADFATVAVARAALLTGRTDEGLRLMSQAVSADHENPRIQQLVGKALTDTGQAAQIERIVHGATTDLKARVQSAKRLLRGGQLDEALGAIERDLAEFPENTTVLLECAQINCMVMRLNKQFDEERVEQVRGYLARLDKLLPGNDRVAQMRRYLRETLTTLQGAPAGARTGT